MRVFYSFLSDFEKEIEENKLNKVVDILIKSLFSPRNDRYFSELSKIQEKVKEDSQFI
jgi:hypothetical protein